MENEAIENETAATANTGNGWHGVIFNICFILYYYFTYLLVLEESTIEDSYGIGSPILFSSTLGWIILISLVTEPFAIFYKLSYENYSIKGPALYLPRVFLVIMFISRFFIRVVLFIAALQSSGIELENGGVGAGLVATFVFVAELVFAFTITNKDFVGEIKPTRFKEIFTRFILLNMLVLFTFLFKTLFVSLITSGDKGLLLEILTGLLIFITVYLPNTMIQFYSDWRASKTPVQKCLYILSLGIAFSSIILFG